jgi:ABC-type antimicrobial peptide transport system permease subunit
MIAGREFVQSDNSNSARVVIVNEAFVKKFNLGNHAVGTFMADGNSDSLSLQIVGVTKNFKTSDAKEDVPPMFFKAWMQERGASSMTFFVRSSLPMEQITRAIPALMSRIDPTLPVRVKSVPAQFRESVYIDLMISKLSATFAMLATLLAGVGLYGVLAYTVAQRTREIGVRMALGADSLRVKVMVLKQVGGMLAVGGAVGLVGAFGLGQAAASLLYGIRATDPTVFGLSVLVLGAVSLFAAYLPARRASRVSPMQALRYE